MHLLTQVLFSAFHLSNAVGIHLTRLLLHSKASPPSQPSDPDWSTFLNIGGVVVTCISLVYSVYLVYQTSVEQRYKVIKTVDLAITIVRIERVPIGDAVWKKVRDRLHRTRRTLTIIEGILFFYLVLALIFYATALFPLTPTVYLRVNLWIALFIALGILTAMILIGRTLERVGKRYLDPRRLPERPDAEKIMEKVILSVHGDYRYILAKARWSLKQLGSTVFDITAASVKARIKKPFLVQLEGNTMRVTVTPDLRNEHGYRITVEFIPELETIDSYRLEREISYLPLKGRYLNQFIDLMGSNGLSLSNPDQ